MELRFPSHFQFGTSTSAAQIETPFEHDWLNVKARDGYIFDRTTDHEKRLEEDVEIIASLAGNYRMSLMWSKLQRAPLAELDEAGKAHYHRLLRALRSKNVNIMIVIHHFANPVWFAKLDGWEKVSNIELWTDFAKKIVDEFGAYASSWNTFNEPNLYASMGWVEGEFPPFKKNLFLGRKVIANLAKAHEEIFPYIKSKFPQQDVGISLNCTLFEAENFLGRLPAWFTDQSYLEYPASLFKSLDFFGMSYYARIGFDPFPVTYILNPEKFGHGREHDDMWEYYPEGLGMCMERFWKKFKKPIIITENGICTSDDGKRVKAIRD